MPHASNSTDLRWSSFRQILGALPICVLLLTIHLGAYGTVNPPGVMVADINPGSGNSFPYLFTDLNGIAIFAANDGPGWQLWRSDGTASGTFKLTTTLYINPENFTIPMSVANGLVYFNGGGLSVSDGTVAGTKLITSSVTIGQGTAWNGLLYFCGNNQLWKSDGTASGTILVSSAPYAPSGFMVSLDNKLHFTAGSSSSSSAAQLWVTDGTSSGTVNLTSTLLNSVASPGSGEYTVQNNFQLWPMPAWSNGSNIVYFIGYTASGSQIWKSDGTLAGTVAIPQPTWAPGTGPSLLYIDNSTDLYFTADDGTHGNELWGSDGISCTKIIDLAPGTNSKHTLGPMNILNGKLLFVGTDNANNLALWTTNGSAGGTIKVTNIPYFTPANQFIPAIGNLLYWETTNNGQPYQLMVTDGTAGGTQFVTNSTIGIYDQSEPMPRPIGNAIFWQGTDGTHGQEVFTLANQPPSVAVAASIAPNPIGGTVASLSVLGTDDGGEPLLTYTWSLVNNTLASPIISINGTNAAKNTLVTFKQAGTYTFLVTITDRQGAQVTSQVVASVSATPNAIQLISLANKNLTTA